MIKCSTDRKKTGKKIRMIALDLDGTLLTSDKVLTDRTKDVLRRAIEQGIVVLPATGRPLSGIPKEVMEFPGVRYAVTANGARIVDSLEGRILYEDQVSYENGKKVLEICGKYDALLEVYYNGVGYTEESALNRLGDFVPRVPMAAYILNTRQPVENVTELFNRKKLPTDKVQAIFSSEEDCKKAWKEVEDHILDIEITGALCNNIEVNAKGVNKGKGILMLGKILGIEREEIMAFGDGRNDTAMLQEAGLGIAMSNAVEEAKAAADEVTLSNDEEGVAAAIEKYVLDGDV